MDTTRSSRSTRDRPAKAPLSEDAVVDAAMAILTSEGAEAVTMRRVATALDTGPASLYVYVDGRTGLVRAMQDRVFAAVALKTPTSTRWRSQLHALLGRMRAAFAAHPGMAATTLATPPVSAAALRFQENLLATLLAGGIGARDLAWAGDILSALVVHAAIEADVRRTAGPDDTAALVAMFRGLPPEQFPVTTTHATRIAGGSSAQRFTMAVDVVLDGLLARATR